MCFAFASSVTLLPRSSRFTLTFLIALLHRALCFALAFSVASLPQEHSHSESLCFFELHARILDCFALSDFVLRTRVYYIVCHFAPSGFALCTHILSCFAPSGFALCTRILGLFAPSSLALCAHTLLALLTHVLSFYLTKTFEKKCVSIESKCSEKHRNEKSLALWAYSVALLPQALRLHSWSLCSLGLHALHLHSQSLCSSGLHASHLHYQSLCSLNLCSSTYILARFAPYTTSVSYIISHFTSSGFVLRTGILSHLATSGFALAFLVTSLSRALYIL